MVVRWHLSKLCIYFIPRDSMSTITVPRNKTLITISSLWLSVVISLILSLTFQHCHLTFNTPWSHFSPCSWWSNSFVVSCSIISSLRKTPMAGLILECGIIIPNLFLNAWVNGKFSGLPQILWFRLHRIDPCQHSHFLKHLNRFFSKAVVLKGFS